MRRALSRAALALVAANLLFAVAVVASQCVGRERVAAEVRDAAEAGHIPAADYPPLPLPALNADRRFLDGFTECMSLALLVLGDPHAPVASALRSPTLAAPATGGICAGLRSLVATHPAATALPTLDYFVYWHGAQVLARPIVALAGPLALRVTVAMLLLLAFAWLIVELARTGGGAVAAIVAASLLVLADLANAAPVTAHAVALAIVLATTASVARSLRRPRDAAARVVWSAAAGGAAFAFVDLLVNPPLGPTLLAAIVLLHRLEDRTPTPARVARALGTAVTIALVWFGAWAATWCARWALAAVAIGFDPVVAQVRARAAFRIAGAWTGVRHEPFAATAANLDAIGIAPVAVVIAMAAIAFGVAMLRGHGRAARAAGFAAFAAIAALPVLWFEVLRNHSQIHAWFTFRSLASSAAALLLGALWALRARSNDAPIAKQPAVPLRHSISFCTTCMGRRIHLEQTLPENLAVLARHAGRAELVLLDYGSRDGLGDWVRNRFPAELASGLLRYARTDEPSVYHPPHAKNAVFRIARHEILFNLDADNFIGDDTCERLDALFAESPQRFAVSSVQPDVGGRLGFLRSDFAALGGWDERYQGWSIADFDLCERARKGLGLAQIDFVSGSAIRHDDAERVRHMPQWTAASADDEHELAALPEARRAFAAKLLARAPQMFRSYVHNQKLLQQRRAAGRVQAQAPGAYGLARLVDEHGRAIEST